MAKALVLVVVLLTQWYVSVVDGCAGDACLPNTLVTSGATGARGMVWGTLWGRERERGGGREREREGEREGEGGRDRQTDRQREGGGGGGGGEREEKASG